MTRLARLQSQGVYGTAEESRDIAWTSPSSREYIFDNPTFARNLVLPYSIEVRCPVVSRRVATSTEDLGRVRIGTAVLGFPQKGYELPCTASLPIDLPRWQGRLNYGISHDSYSICRQKILLVCIQVRWTNVCENYDCLTNPGYLGQFTSSIVTHMYALSCAINLKHCLVVDSKAPGHTTIFLLFFNEYRNILCG